MIERDDYLLPPSPGNYMTVRSLVVRGENEEIGADLATLARDEYGVRLPRYHDPLYGRARLRYLEQRWPALAARSRGVARTFDLAPDGGGYDPTVLLFDTPLLPSCSAVWIPPALSEQGRPLVGRNLDWFTLTLSEISGQPPAQGEQPSFSRCHAVTFVPDTGYVSTQLGGHDLLNPMIDGINDAGLHVAILVDHTGHGDTGAALAGGYDSGLSTNQLVGLLVGNCATVEEAKLALLDNHIFSPFGSEHWLIADAAGAATVFEIDADSRQYRFTDAPGDTPFIVTNHALHAYPTPDTFPSVDPAQEHNTFNRYRCLGEGIARHSGLWSQQDLAELMDTVACAYVDDGAAGVSGGLRERTLWSYVADLADPTLRTRFYRNDIGPEPGTNHMRVSLSDPVDLGPTPAFSAGLHGPSR